MGGSATSCDILNDLIHCYGKTPSTVVRAQDIPSTVNKHSLVIVNSVSGNTRESISNMEQEKGEMQRLFVFHQEEN